MEGHMALYKNVLHHAENTVGKWFLEVIGVFVSQLNTCPYCVDHHFEGLKRLLNDDTKANAIKKALMTELYALDTEGPALKTDPALKMEPALKTDPYDSVFSTKESIALLYAKKLTISPSTMVESDVDKMRESGWNDGEILEINQVAAYFNYANRTVLGLGVTTQGDHLGLSPNDSSDPKNWKHA